MYKYIGNWLVLETGNWQERGDRQTIIYFISFLPKLLLQLCFTRLRWLGIFWGGLISPLHIKTRRRSCTVISTLTSGCHWSIRDQIQFYWSTYWIFHSLSYSSCERFFPLIKEFQVGKILSRHKKATWCSSFQCLTFFIACRVEKVAGLGVWMFIIIITMDLM